MKRLTQTVSLLVAVLFVWEKPMANVATELNPSEWTFSLRHGLRLRPVWHRTIREGGRGPNLTI